MYPRLVVSTTDESFSALWPALAEACGISLIFNAAATQGTDITLTATSQGVASAGRHFSLPTDQDRLAAWIRNQIDEVRKREARASFTAGERTKYRFEGIVGIPGVLASAEQVMPHPNARVTLTGETGTGKTLLARAIHYEGPRHAAPFVEVDCTRTSALALFGDERQPGILDLAAGGTLVLNAVTQLSDELLGAIADGQFDVRTIATSSVDLSPDLCRRLGAKPITLPPLRARRNEIAPLAVFFIQQLGEENTESVALDYAELESRDWPGNVRELKTVVERALVLSTPPPRMLCL
ncbi:MAG TPA: sigma 54-interacting transcriptional regulator [Gemmatimonadaceae bacterium]|nr:sigma 54-interacting transcriptional regulator [Gemmatimonadaceae bacterium]